MMQRSPDLDKDGVPYRIYNIGNNHPENLLEFVDVLQQGIEKGRCSAGKLRF